ncbi:MAG: hydroxyacid dehydrogenase [Ruminococcaceae bacterium]|nr:hydroxyacid dehydrogenase [Oscillospiraceae bacterium]
MMELVILDASSIGNDLDYSGFSQFGHLTIYEETSPLTIIERVRNADVLILNKVRLTRTILSEAPKVRLICEAATGFDNIDLEYCKEKGIAVCNVVGYSTQSVAQLTVAMALSLISNLSTYRSYVASGEYTKSGKPNLLEPVYHEIAGKTWGILGYGNIGKQVARVAEALGCKVIVHKRKPVPDADCVSLEELCRRSDILSIHTPLNDETRNLLNRDRIAMLKRNCIVINVARGAVTDEGAIAEAILTETIGGLGVDVYSQEPFPAEHPFSKIKDFSNVLLTPHMAWGGYETRVRLLQEMVENARAFFAGEIRNRVDKL